MSYPTVKDARFSILVNWKRRRFIGSFYWCPKCQSYHLTSKGPSNNGYRRI